MPSNIPSFILGYHGCDKDIAEQVLAGKANLKLSTNEYDWLGGGIYFWENNPYRAFQWAKDHIGKTSAKIKTPYAVGAIIDPGHCLDLTEAKSIELIKKTYEMVKSVYENLGVPLPKNKNVPGNSDFLIRDLDCFVINALHFVREDSSEDPFNTVRSPYFEGNRLYADSGFHEKSHIQICVRDPKSILGYFRILDKEVFE